MTTNLRALIHMSGLRLCTMAQWEIRRLFQLIRQRDLHGLAVPRLVPGAEVRAARLLRRVRQPRRALPDPAAQGQRPRRVGGEGRGREGRRSGAAAGLIDGRSQLPVEGAIAPSDRNPRPPTTPPRTAAPALGIYREDRQQPLALPTRASRRCARRRRTRRSSIGHAWPRASPAGSAPRGRDEPVDEDRPLPRRDLDAPPRLTGDPASGPRGTGTRCRTAAGTGSAPGGRPRRSARPGRRTARDRPRRGTSGAAAEDGRRPRAARSATTTTRMSPTVAGPNAAR